MTTVAHLPGGLWGILATPFMEGTLELDEESLRRETALFRDLGATGVVALGVFGEGAALDSREQERVVELVCESGGSLPVVVGVSARTTAVAIEQGTRACAVAGSQLHSLMVQVHSPQSSVLAPHLRAIHQATGAGIVLQDYPVVSGVTISTAEILATLHQSPFITAVKAEAPPTARAIADLTQNTDVPVFGGLGGIGLIDELAAGAAGAMTGFSWPEGLLEAVNAWQTDGISALIATWSRWLPLANFESQPGVGLALRKEMLRLRGIFESAAVRPPSPSAPASLTALMHAHIHALGLQTQIPTPGSTT